MDAAARAAWRKRSRCAAPSPGYRPVTKNATIDAR